MRRTLIERLVVVVVLKLPFSPNLFVRTSKLCVNFIIKIEAKCVIGGVVIKNYLGWRLFGPACACVWFLFESELFPHKNAPKSVLCGFANTLIDSWTGQIAGVLTKLVQMDRLLATFQLTGARWRTANRRSCFTVGYATQCNIRMTNSLFSSFLQCVHLHWMQTMSRQFAFECVGTIE